MVAVQLDSLLLHVVGVNLFQSNSLAQLVSEVETVCVPVCTYSIKQKPISHILECYLLLIPMPPLKSYILFVTRYTSTNIYALF